MITSHVDSKVTTSVWLLGIIILNLFYIEFENIKKVFSLAAMVHEHLAFYISYPLDFLSKEKGGPFMPEIQ